MRKVIVRTALLAGTVAVVVRATRGEPASRRQRSGPAWARDINSHEAFEHDSIDSLGYDWSRIADPSVKPQFPSKVYLPRTTEDVVRALAEARANDEHLVIRSKGHSSNDLVLTDGGSVLLTEKLNRVLEIDEQTMTATVQAGAISADIDELLAARGLGLPVIGDHNHITVGGFTSVGGISASSFEYGLFVDTVERIEFVTWDGEVVQASRTENREQFYRVLLGLGRHGVITTVTVRLNRIEKYATIWKNDQCHYFTFEAFLKGSRRIVEPPAEAKFMRGMWVDAGPGGIGMFSCYRDTEQNVQARRRNDLAYGFLHRVGFVAGKLPVQLDRALKYVGFAGIVFSPAYATVKNAESFSDKIIDATVGDPTRYLVALARAADYEELSRRLLALMRSYRQRHRCFGMITLYLKGIRSEYLAAGNPDDYRWVEVLFYVSVHPERMTTELLDQLATEMDDICIEMGAYRYMHSKTSKDPKRLDRIDPNRRYAEKGA